MHDMDDDAMIDALSHSMERLGCLDVDHKLARQIDAVLRNPGQRKSWRFTNRAPVVYPEAERNAA